jgi:hypothetical protein
MYQLRQTPAVTIVQYLTMSPQSLSTQGHSFFGIGTL